jgi:NAD-dependent dihydropyrimidine dehydrogenase PreA subunit
MSTSAYERLADALDRLPNGFPRTPAGAELRILAMIFSEQEASLAVQLSGAMEPIEAVAERMGIAKKEAASRLIAMARRGLVWLDRHEGALRVRLAPFIVGIYEAQLDRMDHELAHLVERYLADGGAAGIMGPEPALHRVVPAQSALKREWILPYDDVRAILLNAKSFFVRDCICRVQQDQIGRRCTFPLDVCLSFSSQETPPGEGVMSQEEALALLERAEEIGLVHTVSNVRQGIGYVCNCCGCCCGILRGITDFGIETSVAHANYFAVIDAEECLGCGVCVERCQVHAIAKVDGVAVVDRARCIGCGLCVTGCPHGVARLERRPEAEIVEPPADYAAWEHERLHRRGLAE